MRGIAAAVGSAIRARPGRWLAVTFGITALYYAALLGGLVLRFGHLPNYATAYDWPGNIARIFASTPSWSDAIAISRDEWLLEVGYMNTMFGHGISEWSMTLIPPKMAVIALLGALVATISVLMAERSPACATVGRRGILAAGSGAGAALIGVTGATASWVVCCATPSWIVGLAMLGLSLSTANWLEPLGPWLSFAGFALLSAIVLLLAYDEGRSSSAFRREERRSQPPATALPERA
jgi:hypothetical protein